MKKHIFMFQFILIGIIILSVYTKLFTKSIETFNFNVQSPNELKNELIIAFMINNIENDIVNFYSQYYSGNIAIYNYEVIISEIKKENNLISVKFGVTPQIGAHNPLGYDELTYLFNSRGNHKLSNYNHIKSYSIPEKFQKFIIKSID